VASLFPHTRRKSKYEKYREGWCLLDCTRQAVRRSARCANDVEAWLTLPLTSVGRTLWSVALDVGFAVDFELEDQKTTPKTEINGDGQECPSYISQRQRQRRRVILSLYGWGSATKFDEDVLSGDVWVSDECA
jgi:hypothetical protein